MVIIPGLKDNTQELFWVFFNLNIFFVFNFYNIALVFTIWLESVIIIQISPPS